VGVAVNFQMERKGGKRGDNDFGPLTTTGFSCGGASGKRKRILLGWGGKKKGTARKVRGGRKKRNPIIKKRTNEDRT